MPAMIVATPSENASTPARQKPNSENHDPFRCFIGAPGIVMSPAFRNVARRPQRGRQAFFRM
jgi:hypothetical protein